MIHHKVSTANAERCPDFGHRIKDWTPTDWATAVAGEVGEMCNLIKKIRRGENIPIDAVAKEAADVVIYLDLLCQRLGIDLGDAVISKFNIDSERIGSNHRLSVGNNILL